MQTETLYNASWESSKYSGRYLKANRDTSICKLKELTVHTGRPRNIGDAYVDRVVLFLFKDFLLNAVISGFWALRQARVPLAELEPVTEGSQGGFAIHYANKPLFSPNR
ncbi:hypothetical protein PoB_000142100 [Plakobranchus ocellatus]|uniref:Uncharacterized protein n=1 Tax=Plakobranchus ocellatus TaxID=259542 RepID=A0AAV3X0D3_9GAST|nr:hypothetical protein PoB_000142100 [Plakobranchus ocellatus]